MNTVLDAVRGGLVVSCQAYPGEPMLDPRTMAQVAQAVEAGGAVAVRGKGLDDLRAMRAVVDVPIIGLVKVGDTGVYITPTLAGCLAVAATGCEVVALDGTRRPRPDGRTLAETVAGLKAEYPDVLVMADCGSVADAEAAVAAGVDILGTTLAGYTGERPKTDGPDWEVVDGIVAWVPCRCSSRDGSTRRRRPPRPCPRRVGGGGRHRHHAPDVDHPMVRRGGRRRLSPGANRPTRRPRRPGGGPSTPPRGPAAPGHRPPGRARRGR